jgi:hypothetical protein
MVIERALLSVDGPELLPEHLPPPTPVVADAEPAPSRRAAARAADDERARILAALARAAETRAAPRASSGSRARS